MFNYTYSKCNIKHVINETVYLIFIIHYTNLNMLFKGKIAKIRESKNLKQSEVAERMGIDQPHYSRLEKRGDKLSIEQLKSIATALDVSINDLLDVKASSHSGNYMSYTFSKTSRIPTYEPDIFESISNRILVEKLYKSLASEIVIYYSVQKNKSKINELYELTDSFPFCKIKVDSSTNSKILEYLSSKSDDSLFYKAFCTYSHFEHETLRSFFGRVGFVATHRNHISLELSAKLENNWPKDVAQHDYFMKILEEENS